MVFDKTGALVEHTFNGQPQPLRSPRITARPLSEWPIWAKAFKQFATPEDKGLGDTVARMIGDENSEAFKVWYKKTTGKDCGCKGRQKRWNVMYPLK